MMKQICMAACAAVVWWSSMAPAQTPPAKSVVGTVSLFKADTAEIEIQPDNGAPVAMKVTADTIAQKVAPFHCTEEDIRSAGLGCSEEDPCPVYLELSAVESTGLRIFAAGNIHAATATLYTVLLGSDDNGQTWREVYERVRGAGLDHIQFADVETGWTSGLSFGPLPQDPFLLMTTDGGKTWRSHEIFNEPRFGSIQQFYFEDRKSGSL